MPRPAIVTLRKRPRTLLARKLAARGSTNLSIKPAPKPTQGGRPWPPKEALPPKSEKKLTFVKAPRLVPTISLRPAIVAPLVVPTSPSISLPEPFVAIAPTKGGGTTTRPVTDTSSDFDIVSIDKIDILETAPSDSTPTEVGLPSTAIYGGIALALGVVYLLATRKK